VQVARQFASIPHITAPAMKYNLIKNGKIEGKQHAVYSSRAVMRVEQFILDYFLPSNQQKSSNK